MMYARNKPLLITGSIRSGSTWLGEMLALAPNTLSVYEPFSLNTGRYAMNGLAKHWFAYAPSMPQEQALDAFQKVLNGNTGRVFRRKQIQRYLSFARHKRLIIKDPIACFSTPWIADHFDVQVVIVVRHPAAFALSLKRVAWSFDFSNLWKQTELWQQFPEVLQQAMCQQPHDIVKQACLLWNATYGSLLDAYDTHPDWLLLRHEDVSQNPAENFQMLYQKLDLSWNAQVKEKIIAHTGRGLSAQPQQGKIHSLKRDSAASVKRWKHELPASEIDYILNSTWATAQQVYDEKEFFT